MKLTSFLACLLLFTATSSSADEYTEQVKVQVSLIKIAASEDGWEDTHEDFYGTLSEGESASFDLELESGLEYRIFSACDQDCDDLDLRIYDENDNSIGTDTMADDLPVVAAEPEWTGPFQLIVTMHSCSDDPCSFGIAVLGR